MSPANRAKPKTPGKRQAALTVRMYNVGFGDCFLLSLPGTGRPRRILFDCGTIASDRPIKEVAAQVVKDATDKDGVARIDVVVATHRHRDHVSGFDNPIWQQVAVQEVWMPWTEHPEDGEARKIRETQSQIARLLESHIQQRMAVVGAEAPRCLGVQELALNALSNAGAMQTLHEGFTGKPLRRFLPTEVAAERTFETAALPGVKIHVLGPSRSKEVIRDMDPPLGQSYLRLVESLTASQTGAPDAFNENWWIDAREYPYPNLGLTEEDRGKMRRISAEMELAVAASLDKAVNGTSLMLMLEINQVYLLFPGDAQWGTWQAALNDPISRDLLKRTRFYKIGHHGSHNATPAEFVERTVGTDFWAMASTKAVPQWPNIPRQPLLDALRTRTQKIARSDEGTAVTPAFKANGDFWIDASIPI